MAGLMHPHGRLRRSLAGAFAATVIALAVLLVLLRVALPLLDGHPQAVAAWLSQRLHQPVSLQSVQAQWRGAGPVLRLHGLCIGAGEQPLCLPRARLDVDFGAWTQPQREWLRLRVRDVEARLQAGDDGWHLAGIALATGGQVRMPPPLPIAIVLDDVHLAVRQPARGLTLDLHIPALRAVSRGGRWRVAGRVRAAHGDTIQFAASLDPGARAGTLYLHGADLDLARWSQHAGELPLAARQGHGSVAAWLHWKAGRIRRTTLQLDMADLVLTGSDASIARIPKLAGILQMATSHGASHWRWQPADAPEASLALAKAADGRIQARARHVDLARLAPWLGLYASHEHALLTRLASLRPWGQLRQLRVDWHDRAHFSLHARLQGVGWKAGAGLPGMDHLSGVLRGDGQAVALQLPSQPMTLAWPAWFREPFSFADVSGSLAWWRDTHGWHVATGGLHLRADGFTARLRGGLHAAPGRTRPTLDVTARASDARVPAAKLFWPLPHMPETAIAWLDRALVAGQVNGRALFRGNLADWPFDAHGGRFEAVGEFRDAVLDYQQGWPRATGLAGQARFVDTSMQISAHAGKSLDNSVRHGQARIADLRRPDLKLQLSGDGEAHDLLAWLRQTPIGKEHARGLDAIQLQADAAWQIGIDLPLSHDDDSNAQVRGDVQLRNGTLRASEWSLALDDLQGDVRFDDGAVRGKTLTANYQDTPVRLDVRIGAATTEPDLSLQANMQGRLAVASLTQAYPDLAALAERARGKARVDVGLRVAKAKGQAKPAARLRVDSDLDGIQLKLPAPLGKPAPKALPLHLVLDMAAQANKLHVRLGDVLDARVRLPVAGKPVAADLSFGGKARQPGARGIAARGVIERLDVGAWLALASSGGGEHLAWSDLLPLDVDLQCRQVLVHGQSLGALDVGLATAQSQLTVSLDGDAVAGTILVPLAQRDRRGITLRLERLHWPSGPHGKTSQQPDGVIPAAIPPLHVRVNDLRLGQADLGKVRLETVPLADAMQVEHFQSQSDTLQINARGTWRGTGEAARSQFSVDLTADDLGRMLAAFGFPKLVAGGATLLHITGDWPGSPLAFALPELVGKIKLHVTDGRILEVDPGMGRLFGLFSIRELPRRLSLDFGDIFQSGFAFNSIRGQLRFDGGNAWNRDLQIHGPAADVRIHGRIGLHARDYDETVTVIPHLGTALPVVGALAGGPVGAAAGLAVQALLGAGMDRAGARRYRITGSWQQPDIREVDSQPQGVAPAPASSSTPAHPASVPPAPSRTVAPLRLPGGDP